VRDDEIRETITSSSPSDWTVIGKDDPRFPAGGEGGQHTFAALYKPDPDLRLAWGLAIDGPGIAEQGWTFSDKETTRQVAEAWLRGELAARWSLLLVDGYRCYVPEHHPEYPAGWTVKKSEYALAKLLMELRGKRDWGVDARLRQTGAQIVDG
jgi:hypothetical protein